MAPQIKRAGTADCPLIAPLLNSYRVFYGQQPDTALAEKFITERLQNGESVIFMALHPEAGETTPVGFTQLYPSFSSVRAEKDWILNDLFVAEPYRKAGIARQLMQEALQFAKKEGATAMQLETAPDNRPAQRLYESLGFERQTQPSPYYLYTIPL